MGEKEKKSLIFYFNPSVEQAFKIVEKGGKRSKTVNDIRNVVFPGQVILRVEGDDFIDPAAFERQDFVGIAAGSNVALNKETKVYKSKIYGFAIVKSRKIVVEPLVQFSKDKLSAYMYYLPNKDKRYPTLEEIRKTIVECNYKGYLEDKQITKQIDDLTQKGKNYGILTICKGKAPKDGQIEHFVLIKDVTKKVGTIIEGDRIDYKEKDTFTRFKEGEPVLERKPYIAAEPGFDVLGNELKGKMLGKKDIVPGNNLGESKEDPNLFVAQTNGVIAFNKRKVNIENRTIIKSDVDLDTGNINIEGIVEIFGNVKSGFSVKSTSDIIIHGNVEDATIRAEGSVVIDHGVLGKEKAFIQASDNIRVRFAQNASFRSGNDVIVQESLIQCNIFAKNGVFVEGTVIGGEVIGKNGINVKIAGSEKGVETRLTVGVDPEIEEKIRLKDEEKREQELIHTDILEDMKMQFGNQFLLDLKGFLSILRGSRKIKFIEMLTKLGNANKEVNKIKKEIQKLRLEIHFEKLPIITIRDKVFADVVLQIRRAHLRVKQTRLGTSYKEDTETGMIIE